MLSARAAVVRRAGFRLEADAFEAPTGLLHALVGANGSGKTTWLHLLCGALRPASGEVLAFGGPPGPPDVLYLPPRPEDALLGADRQMEVEAALSLGGVARALARGRLETVERLLDLPPQRGDSQAERFYRALIGLVSQSPRVLLLDEPTARVGPDARRWIHRALERLRLEGLVIVVATHDPELVRLADRVSVIAGGRVQPASLKQAVEAGLLRAPALGRVLGSGLWDDPALGLTARAVLRRVIRP